MFPLVISFDSHGDVDTALLLQVKELRSRPLDTDRTLSVVGLSQEPMVCDLYTPAVGTSTKASEENRSRLRPWVHSMVVTETLESGRPEFKF